MSQKNVNKFLAGAVTATMVATAVVTPAAAASFKDISNIDANTQKEIERAVDLGYFVDAEQFNPKGNITRGQVAKVMAREIAGVKGSDVAGLKAYVEANNLESKVKPFTDVKNDGGELYYASLIVKDAGAFTMSKLNWNDDITRSQMAKVLVGSFGLEYKADNAKLITDIDNASTKYFIQVLASNDVTQPQAGKFYPVQKVTRQQMASFVVRAHDAASEHATVASIKAINSTTVEVTYKEEVQDVKALKFTIDGLKVESAVVKQTDKKVVVLTTSAQEGNKEYSVKESDAIIGKFTGISAVIPTAINVTTPSVQGTIGKEVTVSAQVSVPEGQAKAGIPVTFNIVNDNSNLNDKVEVVAYTNADGVASYSYTRYYAHNDKVVAYATQKSSVSSNGVVYWNAKLAISEITTGNDLANNTKKSYKVNGAPNTTYQIALAENINVTPDKVNKAVKVISLNGQEVTPSQVSGSNPVFAEVRTNANGEGSFTVFGVNGEATPVVYLSTSTNKAYTKFDLQAQAPTVKFSQVDRLAIAVAAEGTANSAEYAKNPAGLAQDTDSVGGRTYTVTVTDKEGKIAPQGSVAYVTFEEGNYAGDVYVAAHGNFEKVNKGTVKQLIVGKDGKVQFRVAGQGALTFVKPTVFLNTAGKATPVELDKADIQAVGEVTYFKAPVVNNAVLKVTDQYGRTVSSLNAGQDAYFTYQAVDQNGFPYRPTATVNGSTTTTVWVPVTLPDGTIGYKQETITTPGTSVHEYNLSFDVTSTFGDAIVKDALGQTLPVQQNLGNTKTYTVKSDATGKAIVRVTSANTDLVSVNVTGANNILPTAAASIQFLNSTIVPDAYSGNVASYNSEQGTLTFEGKAPVSMFGDKVVYKKGNETIQNYDAFVKLLADAKGAVSVTRVVQDGVATFNIYNISTTGKAPVDTATTTAADKKLADAKALAASKVEADYTADSYKALTDALALAEGTDAEKVAKAAAIDAAVKNLVEKPVVAEGIELTSFTSAQNMFGLTVYTVEGTVASGSAKELKLTVVYEDDKTTEVTATDVTFDGKNFIAKFNELALGDAKVKSVKHGDKSVDLK